MWAIGLVIGALIGGAHNASLAALGAIVGLAAGIWAGSWKKSLTRRLGELEARVNSLQPLPVGGVAPSPIVQTVPTAAEIATASPAAAQRSVDNLRSRQATAAARPVRKGGRGVVAPIREDAPVAGAAAATPAGDAALFDGLATDAMAGKPHQPAWLAWIRAATRWRA